MDESRVNAAEQHGLRDGRIDAILLDILKQLVGIDGKLDSEREWRTKTEIRLAALENFKTLSTWVIGIVSALVISGTLGLLWALLTHTLTLAP